MNLNWDGRCPWNNTNCSTKLYAVSIFNNNFFSQITFLFVFQNYLPKPTKKLVKSNCYKNCKNRTFMPSQFSTKINCYKMNWIKLKIMTERSNFSFLIKNKINSTYKKVNSFLITINPQYLSGTNTWTSICFFSWVRKRQLHAPHT